MWILVIGAVALVGIFLGIGLFCLLSMAQEAEKIHDLLDRREGIATPEDTYYLQLSETFLASGGGKGWPPGDPGESRSGSAGINNAKISRIPSFRGVDLQETT